EEELPPEENAGEEPEEEEEPELELLTSADDEDDPESFALPTNELDLPPVKATGRLQHALYNRSRRRTHGASKTHMPDFKKMTGHEQDSLVDPYDNEYLKTLKSSGLEESTGPLERSSRVLSQDMQSVLRRMTRDLGISPGANGLISEGE